ncbi:uncharacterized protein L969DRAFT_91543 [Mixia osmundae IAM 14324]|uniref:uncharacterized protein n=1 Tax=Mixia osmundae (strain CBS 9802 / IAM 14324 / JCM 22182 / KY 12970) TaxID=764103 RepID=UPI0004A54D4F|nr:uncharacterized protein L969DRAFT_91543 [Mixia osmundae IAM 14324]KEI42079.1 hypothetical protein L969DRAFT_91543 [Mixia osmundae IAM 14324]
MPRPTDYELLTVVSDGQHAHRNSSQADIYRNTPSAYGLSRICASIGRRAIPLACVVIFIMLWIVSQQEGDSWAVYLTETGHVDPGMASEFREALRHSRSHKPIENVKFDVYEPTEPHTATVIWIHELGGTTQWYKPLMTSLSHDLPSIKWILPQAARRRVPTMSSKLAPSWYDIREFPNVYSREDRIGLRRSARSIWTLVHQENTNGTALDDIFLAGFSQGAVLSLLMGLSSPHPLAGLGIFSGYLAMPEFLSLYDAGHDTMPIFWAHGEKDPNLLYSTALADISKLKNRGHQSLELHSYPNLGHNSRSLLSRKCHLLDLTVLQCRGSLDRPDLPVHRTAAWASTSTSDRSGSAKMDDQTVMAEMKKMVAFIKQEAQEKAREIKTKGDEEANMEKSKIVRQESNSIDSHYERKRKQVEVNKKIATSNQTNKARLKLLTTREELLEEVFEQARSKLVELSHDKSQYETLLKDLILQGLFSMMEKEIKVAVRKEDRELADKVVGQATGTFKEQAGFEVHVEITEDLPDSCAGGVKLTGYNSRIVVDNTLDARLAIAEAKMLPEIGTTLFGKNPNRKHYQ